LKFGACAMLALWHSRADDLERERTFPRDFGSAF
jgi:hypothetical protein